MGIQQTSVIRYGKRLGAVLGLTAAAAMVTLSIVSSHSGGPGAGVLADSGHGSSGGVYTQPAVGGMTVGATQTLTTAASAPVITKAAPAIKG